LERFEEADAICQEGLERFDWSIDLHHCLTQINFVKKDYEKVLKHGAAFLDRCEKLTANFGAFPLFQFETAHRDWVIYRSMGYAHIYFGRLEQGIELLEKAVENVSKHERFQLLEEIGMNLLKIGQKEKAIGLLEMLPIEQASLANGCRALAMAYEDSGRKQEAVDVYQKLKDALPEDPEIPFRMGLLLLELHDYASASEAFEVAAGKAPDHAEAFINWGLALKKQGFYEQAEGKYLHALHMAPENPTAAQNLGLLLLQQSRYPEALPLLQRSLAADPTDTAVALALSRASLETGDIEGMIKPCEFLLRSLDLPSDSTLESLSDLADLYLMIAGGLLTKGQVQAFEMAVDIGLRLGPGSTVIIAGLIHASLDKGEQGIALRLLKAGLLLNPVDEHLTSLGQPLRCIR
jgi:tetratricopeptide (TPR) repeat protein